MWCSSRSEKRFTVWLERAVLGTVADPLAIILPVVSDGVWQRAQPIIPKAARPLTIEGVSGAGAGGANIRIKFANASMSERTAVLGVAVKFSVSSGVALNRQLGVSSRSCGNSWLVTPISTLYASDAKIRRDLFCAFHPKRVIVPSFALRLALPLKCAFGRPEMRNSVLRDDSAYMLARIAESGRASISPLPNTGVGMRKIMFRFPPRPVTGLPAGKKSGCAMLQPTASLRPVMTNRSCTSPSLLPSGLFLNRASRTGPFCAMNQGIMFFAPLSVDTAIRGFIAGLVPPGPGCEWQERQALELKRGPSPLLAPPVTTSIVANLLRPSLKNCCSSWVRPFSGPPAPGAPPRTPGSTTAPPARPAGLNRCRLNGLCQ